MLSTGLGKVPCAIVMVLAAGLLSGSPYVALADVFNMGGTPAATGSGGAVSLSLVDVGDTSNAADSSTGRGSVDYSYKIGTYDVTCAQYCQFLNAVAGSSTYIGYSPASIQYNKGASSPYSVNPGYANRPITGVTWIDAAHFCNWLTNGQQSGSAAASTLENGAYALNGQTSYDYLQGLGRSPNATGHVYALPTVNEWYKAAYYKGGSTNAGYWNYATQSDTSPAAVAPPGGKNSANYIDPSTGNPIDADFGITEVGAYYLSASAYGTFDQNGNVWQWTEGLSSRPDHRILLGGSCYRQAADKGSSLNEQATYPDMSGIDRGFRIAYVPVPTPEPISLAMLSLAAVSATFSRASKRKNVKQPEA